MSGVFFLACCRGIFAPKISRNMSHGHSTEYNLFLDVEFLYNRPLPSQLSLKICAEIHGDIIMKKIIIHVK